MILIEYYIFNFNSISPQIKYFMSSLQFNTILNPIYSVVDDLLNPEDIVPQQVIRPDEYLDSFIHIGKICLDKPK